MDKAYARSASDKTDDWPAWMVWDGGRNVTRVVAEAIGEPMRPGAVFVSRERAEELVNRYQALNPENSTGDTPCTSASKPH